MKMSSLDLMKSEIKETNKIRDKLNIQERLLWVAGDLYEYSPFLNDNIERAKDVFLCVDEYT